MYNLLHAPMAVFLPDQPRQRARSFSAAPCLVAATVLVVGLTGRGVSAQEEFEGWHLEPGVGQAHLVMVARVVSVSRVTVVEGAKTDVALREFRFQPVRMLKGIFQRDQLSMTAADLGIPADDAVLAPPVQEGEFRLLILVQPRGLRSIGCVTAAPGARTFDERVPRLTGPDDPLVTVVETLIQVADSRSRRERATLLVDRLADASGLSAVPLLSSLRLRADWAAADGRAYAPVARLARDPQTPVRGAAVEVLRDMLASGIKPNDPGEFDDVAAALRETLDSEEAITDLRLAALEALGELFALEAESDVHDSRVRDWAANDSRPGLIWMQPDFAWVHELLIAQLNGAATHVERAAAATALGRVADPRAVAAVLDALAGLPLDEPPERETAYARAAVRLDAAGAERILLARLRRSIAGRQSLEAEIEPLGRMRTQESMPLLLAAAEQLNLPRIDRFHIARALGQMGDDRAVPVLTRWVRVNNARLRESALGALENIDSQLAAREARPLLKSVAHLPYKLRIARLLARHGLADGYALATEHLADEDHTAAATLVLAALDDPRTENDLSAIVAARPDRRWRAAALTGLAAIGDATAQQQLLDILNDDRHPLAVHAAEAAGLANDANLLLPLATLAQSRNRKIAMASLVALRRFLSGVRSSPRGLAAVDQPPADRVDDEPRTPAADVPLETRAAVAEAVASLAVDAYVEANVRREAFAVAQLLGGDRYAQLLTELADQAELEGTPLLAEVQAERRQSDDLFNSP